MTKEKNLNRKDIDKEKIIRWAIENSECVSDAIEKLGCNRTSGGGYRTIKNAIIKYNIDTSHFKRIRPKSRKKINRTNEEIFCENSMIRRNDVKAKYIELVEYKCVICLNAGIHCNKPLSLQLDHINGINNDNRLENLRLICPNCHTQTPTYGSKNKKKTIKENNKIKREEYIKKIKDEWLISQQEKIDKLLSLNIDFMKLGWQTKVAEVLNIKRQKVIYWMQRALPEIQIKRNKKLDYLN